jgi:thienamycin biosynthesis protein ThnN
MDAVLDTSAALDLDEQVQHIIRIHFNADSGSRYWLQRQTELGIDAIARIRKADDLALLGPMREADLCERSILDFVPRSQHAQLTGAFVAETGGTTGEPKRTVFSRSEFEQAFVAPFVRAAEFAGFPRGGSWLWLGPSGPHIIGHAAAACAVALGSPQPFSVDFDPRWFRKLPADSVGRDRYFSHLLEQALLLLGREHIDVLFTTPTVLAQLAERMTDAQRERIRGVHYGGMRVEPNLLRNAQSQWFPNAVHLAGYGNSLFGVCMEFGGPPDRLMRYYPLGHRHLVRLDDDGRVWMTRLDRTILIPNLPERDHAAAAFEPPPLPQGFSHGIEDPRPIRASSNGLQGIY